MTGFIVRIRRGGRMVSVDFDELTDEEFERVELPADDGWQWAIALAKWIRDNLKPQLLKPLEIRLHDVDADQG